MVKVKYFDNGYVIVDGQNVICGGTDKSEAHFALNKLISESSSGGGLDSNIIKSIQRGTSSSDKITINTVNPDKCIVLLNNSCLSDTSYSVYGAYVTNLKANVLEVHTNNRDDSSMTISWQIIEFR
ncbi:hypothetical protein [Holdemanella biformis]|uniref:hypothetical protein n=1 Tax=Holdemanella biformis TaxID=1735 RepID=UPI0024918894|nr:hypothetical protein [Holdemanella biformis]